MSNPTGAVLIAFVVAAIAAWVFLDHAVATWRAANDRDFQDQKLIQYVEKFSEEMRRRRVRARFGPAIDAAQQRNAKPAPKVSDFPRKSER